MNFRRSHLTAAKSAVIAATALSLVGSTALAQSSSICRDEIYRADNSLQRIERQVETTVNENRNLERSVREIDSLSAQLAGAVNIDINGHLSRPLDSASTKALRAAEALHNVRSLLDQVLSHPDASAELRAIVQNAINNNLEPARSNINSARSELERLPSQLSGVNQQLGSLSNSAVRLQRLSSSSSQLVNREAQLLNNILRDTSNVRRDVRDLTRYCY